MQGTIQRAELTAVLRILRRIVGPTTVHVDRWAFERRNEVHWSKSEGMSTLGLWALVVDAAPQDVRRAMSEGLLAGGGCI